MLHYSKFVNTKAYQKSLSQKSENVPAMPKTIRSSSLLRQDFRDPECIPQSERQQCSDSSYQDPVYNQKAELVEEKPAEVKAESHRHASINLDEMQKHEDMKAQEEDWLAFFLGKSPIKEVILSDETAIATLGSFASQHADTSDQLSSRSITTPPPPPEAAAVQTEAVLQTKPKSDPVQCQPAEFESALSEVVSIKSAIVRSSLSDAAFETVKREVAMLEAAMNHAALSDDAVKTAQREVALLEAAISHAAIIDSTMNQSSIIESTMNENNKLQEIGGPNCLNAIFDDMITDSPVFSINV